MPFPCRFCEWGISIAFGSIIKSNCYTDTFFWRDLHFCCLNKCAWSSKRAPYARGVAQLKTSYPSQQETSVSPKPQKKWQNYSIYLLSLCLCSAPCSCFQTKTFFVPTQLPTYSAS